MSLGVIKVTLLNVALSQAKTLVGKNTVVELSVGTQKSLFFGQGNTFQPREVALFGCQKHKLNIYVYSQGLRQGESVIYGEVNLIPLFDMPKTKHTINVQTIYYSNSSPVNEVSGSIDVEIVCTQTLDSLLEVSVDSAQLYRDTELIGKMDPYVELTLEQVTKKTTVKQQAGKNPVWNQPESKLFIAVKELDVTTSDLVGTAQINLRQQRLLSPTTEWVSLIIDLIYQQKLAGKLNVKVKFAINTFMK